MNQPIYIDRERMDKALASPTYWIPPGLTKEQVIDAILAVADAPENAKEVPIQNSTQSATLVQYHRNGSPRRPSTKIKTS